MEYRQLGASGLKVPVLSFGTGTFGGSNEFFERWGKTDVDEATRLIDICLDAGVNFFDTADVYSGGALRGDPRRRAQGKRDKALISTKTTFRNGPGAMTWAPRAIISCAPARPVSSASAPIISTSISCTASMR